MKFWIKKDNPRAAYDMIARVKTRIDRLATPGYHLRLPSQG